MNKSIFMDIPTMDVPTAELTQSVHCGAGCYVTTMKCTTKVDYDEYLKKVEEIGFVKYADNGEGLDDAVYCSTYTRGDMVLTLGYYLREQKTSIAFYHDLPLSPHLIYRDSYVEGNKEGVKTKLHMLELWKMGNSFVFQLKNGHFLISDGGQHADLPYLLDYLENLTPKGEKPVIEAWIISHAHGDHCGALNELLEHADWRKRIYVEGIYFSEPSQRVTDKCGGDVAIARMKRIARWLSTTEGEPTPFYRPQTGQRYYFNDITMDILLSQEQVPFEKYKTDLNTSSTVCLFTIEGQKCFFSGDIHQEGLQFIMENYSREYLDLDIFTLNHHGFNTSVSFADYTKVKTLLLTLQEQLPVRMIRETKCFISKVQETMRWGDGTKILTFPYELGKYECLPCSEWVYHKDTERKLQINLYTFPGRRLKCFIFNADEIVFEGKILKKGVEKLIKYLQEQEVYVSVYSTEMSTLALQEALKRTEIESYFKLILGCECLDEENPYIDATRRSEQLFKLDKVHKYVVLCAREAVVEAAVQEGIRTIVVKNGEKIGPQFEEKCWKHIDSLEEIYEMFKKFRILFE